MGDVTTLGNDIKRGDLKHAYLLYGEEDLLKSMKKKELLNALGDVTDTMNFTSYEGSNIDIEEMTSLALTMPFFADRRIVLVENSGWFNSSKKSEEDATEDVATDSAAKKKTDPLIDLFSRIPESTYLVFVEQSINRGTKTYKALKKVGDDVELHRQEAPAIKTWIRNTVSKEGVVFTGKSFELFWSKVGDDRTGVDKRTGKMKTGNDMRTIASELEKLISYCYKTKEITEEAVELMVTKRLEEQTFVMTAALAKKDRKTALDQYHVLLSLRQEPIVILGSVRWQIDTLLKLKDLLDKGYPVKQAAERLSMNPYAAEQNSNLCRYFARNELQNFLEECVETEEVIKTGRMNPQMAIEVLIVSCVTR